ncbi:Hypothetical protein KVN_LOCUS79 [uncultured virus]|nr:Hypothetical protein KVN_LOCUS79 [uncultured virus]
MNQIPIYGVCDKPEQFVKKFKNFNGIIYFNPVYRSLQPKEGGWRWCKWGEYIGEYDIENIEYLYEAKGTKGRPLIDEQWLFHKQAPMTILGLSNVIKIISNGIIYHANKNAVTLETISNSKNDLEKLNNFNCETVEEKLKNKASLMCKYLSISGRVTDKILIMSELCESEIMTLINYLDLDYSSQNWNAIIKFFNFVFSKSKKELMGFNIIKYYFDLQDENKLKLINDYNELYGKDSNLQKFNEKYEKIFGNIHMKFFSRQPSEETVNEYIKLLQKKYKKILKKYDIIENEILKEKFKKDFYELFRKNYIDEQNKE